MSPASNIEPENAPAFHEGERAVQRLVGIEDIVGSVGRRFIRSAMPDQHRAFFEQLPFIVLGLLDGRGQPWAMIREGQPGFLNSPDARTLVISAGPLIEPALGIFPKVGDKIGLVGMELPTRRRNRMNGTLTALGADGLTVRVDQSFGNCDQYIQKRDIRLISPDEGDDDEASADGAVASRSTVLSQDSAEAIQKSDTFFIASRAADLNDDRNAGVDVSHRGGRPGFVRVMDDGRLLFPDFSGNKFFNTLGNIMTDNRVGLLFPDFKTGSTLNIAGRAEIIWDGEALESFKGAERLVAVSVDEVVSCHGLLAARGEMIEPSPELKRTGRWA